MGRRILISAARMIPEHFDKNGKPKISYPSQTAAEFAGSYYDLQSYECGFCGKWHNGKKKDF